MSEQTPFTLEIEANSSKAISFEGKEELRLMLVSARLVGEDVKLNEKVVVTITYKESLEDDKEPEDKSADVATFTEENKDLQDIEFNCGKENEATIHVKGEHAVQIEGVFYVDADDEEEEEEKNEKPKEEEEKKEEAKEEDKKE